MKKIITLLLAGVLILCLVIPAMAEPAADPAAATAETADPAAEAADPAAEQADTSGYLPGLTRDLGSGVSLVTAEGLAKNLGFEMTNGIPLYTPANSQPLNVYMVADPDCEIGINGDDIYKVSEKGFNAPFTGIDPFTGLKPSSGTKYMTDYMSEWITEIEAESGNTIEFVHDPNLADVLLVVKMTYPLHGMYSIGWGSPNIEGYACHVQMTAYKLSNPDQQISVSRANTPADEERISSSSKFWKYPPEFEDTEELTNLVDTILGWYGAGAQEGSNGEGVRAAQQSLIDRHFLEGTADGSFGPATAEAVRKLQEYSGLEQTGIIDDQTLQAIYYDQAE